MVHVAFVQKQMCIQNIGTQFSHIKNHKFLQRTGYQVTFSLFVEHLRTCALLQATRRAAFPSYVALFKAKFQTPACHTNVSLFR